ncbi:pre-B-cell leukemia homeobox interacting protein 1b isoform 2-T2 [Odontesthes bonariensis]|uniref:pre-B-cell leukemia homeobox interacting protein 1b isoform X2 n=1 Tax=Odontesthes bonariensis TaxID=219752 RepID=UPI003F58ED84
MSGGSSSNNSWTILTEETVAETLMPLAAGTEQHEESHTSAAGSGESSQPANGAESAERLPAEDYLVSEETAERSGDSGSDQHTTGPSAVTETPLPSSLEVAGASIQGSDVVSQAESLPEGSAQFSSDPDSSSDSYTLLTPPPNEPQVSPLGTETLGGAEFTQDETLHLQNGEELQPEGEESDQYPRSSDLRKQAVCLVEQLVMDLLSIWARRLRGKDVVDSPVDSEVVEERTAKTEQEGTPEESRKRSLLVALEQIGRREEDEEGEDEREFQVPQQEDDSGFSVNKCILGAIILLGLGTIFLSGVLMDLDEESDYVTRELKDAEAPGHQEWLNPEVPPVRVEGDSSELLHKLAQGSQQISVLQAQVQAQKEELKVGKGQAAEGAKERLHWEEVEKENSRLKTEAASLPVLQKENDRMKKELESVPALQKELETLRSTVTELKLSSGSQTAQAQVKPSMSPPTGQPEDSRRDTARSTETQARKPWDDKKEKKDLKRDKSEMGSKKQDKEKEKSAMKEGERKELKDGGRKEWKKGKHEQGMPEKEKDKEGKQRKHSDGTKQWDERKKEKAGRGDDGRPWKDKEGRKAWTEQSEKKERKEDKDWKRGKSDKMNEDKKWRGKAEKKDWQGGRDQGERQGKSKEEWKGEKEWKKMKDGFKESGREKRERKEKGEMKEFKKDLSWKNKNGKDHAREGKEKGERKQLETGKNAGKERMGKDERKQGNEYESKSRNGKQDKEWKRKEEKWDQRNKEDEDRKRGGQKEKRQNGDRKKDKSDTLKNKDEHKLTESHGHKEEHLYGDQKPSHTHHRPSVGQPEYWVQQRDRLRHDPRPPQQCDSLETCAQAERLLPVPLPEFEAILQTYLTKAEEAGVDNSQREELKKLATEFFKDGVFVHDQMSFQDFADDVADMLEDLVEGENGGSDDSAIEEEMEGFEREVMKRFSVPGAGEKEERIKGEWRKESGQRRG